MRSEALIVAQPSYLQWEELPRAAEAARELDGAESAGRDGISGEALIPPALPA